MALFEKYYFPPVHFWTLWFSEAMRYFAVKNGIKLQHDTKLMDVGCGLGYHCFTMSNRGVNVVYGVDISQETMDLLNEFSPRPKFMKLDICKDNIDSFIGFFDTIFSSDVYEHVEDPQVMLNNIYAMLARNGSVCFTFPNWMNHGQNQITEKKQLADRLLAAGFSSHKIEVIDNYSLLYRFFMKLYVISQKVTDIIFSVKREDVKGTSMPESDEFHGMYAFQKIQKLKKHKLICKFLNINYSLLKNILRISPPFITSGNNDVVEKRIIIFAQK